MSWHSMILDRFRSTSMSTESTPLLLLDLTLWHRWHTVRGTLPPNFGSSLQDAHRARGLRFGLLSALARRV